MTITLLLTGKTTDALIDQGVKEYEKRIRHYASFKIILIPELRNKGSLGKKQIPSKEAPIILKHIAPADFLVLLDERGEQMDSVSFASFLGRSMVGSVKSLVFVVGGAYGSDEQLFRRANKVLALSKMTFPHQLVRLIFTEQLYRAMTILKNESYHH